MTKLECSAIRAYAILAIAIHNYCHWLPNTPQENEFEFEVGRHWDFIHSMGTASDILVNLFSYLGHLGVPVFVFLSGYGLSQKYGQTETVQLKSFLTTHYIKLLKPLLIGLLVYVFVMYLKEGEWPSFRTFALQCLMLQNLIVPFERFGSPEPYWYFGMTMQLYVIYILFVYKRSLRWLTVLTVFSLILLVFLGSIDAYLPFFVWMKYNSIGWLLPFLLGVIASRYAGTKLFKLNKGYMAAIMLLCAVLLIILDSQFLTWLLIPAISVVLTICFILIQPQAAQQVAAGVGSISMYIFVIHPIIRELTIDIGYYGNPYWGLLVYVSLTLFLAFMVKKGIDYSRSRTTKGR